jgi:MFS family permease
MPYRIKVAIVYLLGFFVDLINMFIANVAYPSIGHALQASVGELAWVSNGYILGLTLVIPLSAWLAQRIGGRRVFLLSLTLLCWQRRRRAMPIPSANWLAGECCRVWAAGC